MYEDTRDMSQEHEHLALDNAMIDLCISYRHYEYGWKLYEKMKSMDRHTSRIVSQLCLKGFFEEEAASVGGGNNGKASGDSSPAQKAIPSNSLNPNSILSTVPESNLSLGSTIADDKASVTTIPDGKKIWEARAWAFYSRFLLQEDSEILSSVVYVLHQFLEIVADSPETSSRLGKVLRIYHQLKLSSCQHLIHDDYLLSPILRLCLRGMNEAEEGVTINFNASLNSVGSSVGSNSFFKSPFAKFVNFFSSVQNKNEAAQEYFDTAFQVYQDLRIPSIPMKLRKPNMHIKGGVSSPVLNSPSHGGNNNNNSPPSSNQLEVPPPVVPSRKLSNSGSRSVSHSQPIPSLVQEIPNLTITSSNGSTTVTSSSGGDKRASQLPSPLTPNPGASAQFLQTQQQKSRLRICSANVYAILLELCILKKDAEAFSGICRDLVTTAIDIPQPLAKIIQDGHDVLVPHICRKEGAGGGGGGSGCRYMKTLSPHLTDTANKAVQSLFRNQSYQMNGRTTTFSFLHGGVVGGGEGVNSDSSPGNPHNNNIISTIDEDTAAIEMSIKEALAARARALQVLAEEKETKTDPIIILKPPTSDDENYAEEEEDEDDPFLKKIDLQRKAKDLLVHCCGTGSLSLS
jgi:hypothetical protein